MSKVWESLSFKKMNSRILTLPKIQQEEVEDQRPGLVLRKKDVGNDILRYGYQLTAS